MNQVNHLEQKFLQWKEDEITKRWFKNAQNTIDQIDAQLASGFHLLNNENRDLGLKLLGIKEVCLSIINTEFKDIEHVRENESVE